jgi:pyruvate dehydrogenase E1 component beta subunit
VPGLKVITPSNPYDAKGLLKAAIRDNDPVVFMESEKMYGDKGMVPDGEYIIPIGVADVKREGTDVTIVSFGKIMKTVLAGAEELAKEGISAEVIDLRTIRPLDIDTIVNSVKKTNSLIIVEESWPVASISTEIAYRVQRHAFDYLDAPIRRLTQSDTPFAFATTLIEAALPQVADVVRVGKEVLYR